jgi:hypothetical protein
MGTNLADLIGTLNGTNLRFTTPTPYAPGSVVVRWKASNVPGDQVYEIDPANGIVQLTDPPEVGDLLVAAWADPTADAIGQPIFGGIIDRLADLHLEGGNDITIVAGEAGSLVMVTILDKDGNRQDLTGMTLYFMAKVSSEVGAIAFDKSSLGSGPSYMGVVPRDQTTDAGRGIADVVFASDETQAQAGKILTWDFWVKASGKLVPIVEGARCTVRLAVRTSFP